jgi:hypothetical protein
VNQAPTLTFKLTNPSALGAATGVAFMDTLPVGLSGNLVGLNGCSGAVFGINGSTISLSNATIPPGGTCTAQVTVTANAPGAYTNVSGAVMSGACTGGTASATLTVALPPTITKAFADSELQLFGASTALSFAITNPNATALTAIAFTDTLPAGLVVSTPNGLTGSCGGGAITATAGSNSINLTGATLAGGASCTFSVNVTGTAVGVFTNTSGPVTAFGGTVVGNTATASISVDFLFFYWFFAA